MGRISALKTGSLKAATSAPFKVPMTAQRAQPDTRAAS